MIPIREDAQKALTSNVKKPAIVDFFESGMVGLSNEFNKTIDFLIWSKWPKAYMITKDLSEYENEKIKISEDFMH